MSDKEHSSPLSGESTLDKIRCTRDFNLYLDMLNPLKSKYLIILCLKNTTGQNIPEKTVEKIRSLGFSNFLTEPDMRYVGILSNGTVSCDSVTKADGHTVGFDGSISKTKVLVSFENNKEAGIKINGDDYSLNDKGVNVAVYDLRESKITDVSCYNSAEGKPVFYHCNLYCDRQYIESHVYMPVSFMDSVTLHIKRSYFSPRSLNVTEVERGIFLPFKKASDLNKETGDYVQGADEYKAYGGICDESFNFIAGHQVFNPIGIDYDTRHISDSYKIPPKDITYIDETVLYGGSLIEHPGHLIMESFADRLWWVTENTDSNIKIAIEVIWKKSKLGALYNSFVSEFLDAFGISKDRLIIVEKPTQFKKIIIPDQSAIPIDYCFPYDFTSGYIKPFQHITKQLAPEKYKKIYLSKSKLHNKSIIGEEYFIDFFEKKGFKIINPEDHTIKEKAELMYGADEVVTIDGTNSLYSIFCRPSVRLTVLTKRMDYWDTPQQLINEALGIKEFFLVNISGNFLEQFCDKPFFNYSRGMVLAYATTEFAKYVKYIYNEDLDITPEESLKQHFYDYLTHFLEYYTQPAFFTIINNIKMTDILRGMSEVFRGKTLNSGDHKFVTDNELLIKELKSQLLEENESSGEKIQLLSEKAKGFIDEITSLKQTLAQREAEIQRLRKENSELSSYMAEISSLLDALESGGGLPTE